MILEKNVKMIFPSNDLGRRIASEDTKTQRQVLEGFASRQLLNSVNNNQTIINLVAILPSETILWFVKIFQEIIRQKRISPELHKELLSK